jgi:hypothetical protein
MPELMNSGFSRRDIEFLIEAADHRLLDRIDIVGGDPAFIENMLEKGAQDLVQRIMFMRPDTVMATITPRFLFEVILRSARKELTTRNYTIERTGSEKIPVFDANQAVEFIKDDAVLKYLASMLTSFTRIRSFVWPVRVRKGVWRRVRFNDMDMDSLLRFCQLADEEHRYDLYRRIGDLCLFTLGIFPEYTSSRLKRSFSGGESPPLFARRARSAEDYETEGRRFYRLASEHPDSRAAGTQLVLSRLEGNLHLAKKPLNYISEKYLQFQKGGLFHAGDQD